ncbi:STAS domain-containing protein [uncultured Arcticibacterium sp.]|uniref:STAS domain-containing protein n=1 Tax=uncultured Arcticibacterium sp. TaxID=2173042 RepID=UPI0030F62A05
METMIIEGDFTTEKALEWKKLLNKAAQRSSTLHLDLSATEDADIVGVNAIATTFKMLQDKDGSMKLKINEDSTIYKLLSQTKFLDMIKKS